MSDRFKAPNPPKDTGETNITQIEKFREAAKELETDDSEERFDERLKKIAKPDAAKPSTKKGN